VQRVQKHYQRAKDGIKIIKISCKANEMSDKIDYHWDEKEANFADSVLTFVNEYLFPRFKFLKDGRMEFADSPDSLLSFVHGKVKIPEGADYKDQWDRVICPTIQTKYITIRCNLNKKVQKTYKSRCIQVRTKIFQYY
jgi:hypothetical protein